MMSRLSALLPIDTRGMWIGTFHGLCNRMLRAHFRDAGLPATFQILDTADQLSAIKRLMKGLNVDDEKYPAKNLQYFINNAKEQGLRPKDVDATDNFNRKFVELYEAYDQQCQREGVVDFPELLLRCYELLAHNPPLRAHYQARFRHILVDEFQDTNKLQYAWLKLLAGQSNAIFAVGDDDQSIYAFRGANVGNMRDFEHEFNVQHLIKLEQNYRSHGHILDAANQLIANNARRLGKNLRTDAGHGEPVRVYEAATDTQEAGWIVEEIRALINTGLSRSEIAVLYRSNAQSRAIEHTLVNVGIPYRVYGRAALFRAAGSEARARISAPDRQSERRHRARARRQLPGARHRRALDRTAGRRGAALQLLDGRGDSLCDRQSRLEPRRVCKPDREAARGNAADEPAGNGSNMSCAAAV